MQRRSNHYNRRWYIPEQTLKLFHTQSKLVYKKRFGTLVGVCRNIQCPPIPPSELIKSALRTSSEGFFLCLRTQAREAIPTRESATNQTASPTNGNISTDRPLRPLISVQVALLSLIHFSSSTLESFFDRKWVIALLKWSVSTDCLWKAYLGWI